MKSGAVLLFIGLGLACGDARADGGMHRLREALRDLLEDARDESGQCRRAVVNGVSDLRDRLDEMDGRRRKLKMALRSLRDIEADAADDCPGSIRKGLRRAVEILEEASESARDDDDDDDRRDRRRRDRDRDWDRDRDRDRDRSDRDRDRDRDDRPRRVECWNAQDPGCYNTKGGNPPMQRAQFDGIRAAVNAAGPNVFGRLDAIRIGVSNAYLTSLQMILLVRMLKPSVFQMVDAVKACAPRLVDPQNGQGIAAEFGPAVFQARDAAAIVAAQRGD
jgi:hypothetical protein